jgi:putative oxidoreductase
MMIGKYLEGKEEYFYFAFRVLIGFLFFQHGAQKLFGLFGGKSVTLFSLMGLAGVIEFFGGIAIALGLLTRLFAVFTGMEMVFAYLMVHVSNGWMPIVNKGELALLYLSGFLVLIAYGAKKWSVERALLKKEFF